ncbi:hypothetical protein [Enterococcus durans]|uniref:hypothetical protein n=1 Tax=Enterococcus durans TaxID=53345 RepID=UPI0021C4604C|nr:hypothetical protein [Enterococcus durans]
MLKKAITVVAIQHAVKIIDTKLSSLSLNKSSTKVNRELEKKTNVETMSLSIIFISVPNSCNAITNFEFVKAGINEKVAKNNAVAIEEKAKEADIKSVKLLKLLGEILKTRDKKNETTPSIIISLFLSNLPFLIVITLLNLTI